MNKRNIYGIFGNPICTLTGVEFIGTWKILENDYNREENLETF